MSRQPTDFDPQGLYARLGVEPLASTEAIVAAYRRKARLLHPDVVGTGNVDAFVAVKAAYDLLTNPLQRAAYDRAARPATTDRPVAGAGSPSTTFGMPAYRRQPRFSDLPMAVWIGMAALLMVGVVEIAVHLRGLHPSEPQIEIRTNAPIALPASPARPRVFMSGSGPLRLIGTPNYFTVPAAGPTVVWRRDGQRNSLVPVGLLPPFSSVQALRLFRQSGMVEVRLTDTLNGYVSAARLEPGDATAARRAYCGYSAGDPPADGEVLKRHGSGASHLTVVNRTSQPVVVKLRDPTGVTMVAVFLAPNGHAEIDDLPDLRFRLDYAIGELWSRTCGAFAAGMRAQRLEGYFPLSASTHLVIPPDVPGGGPLVDISDQAFQRD
jgi:hypothetical protein